MSPEFVFDPSTGTASEIHRGHMQPQENAADVPTIEQVEEHHLNQQAANYARRHGQTTQAVAGGSDNLEVELQLQEIQAQIFNETDNLKQQILIQKSEQLARLLVGDVEGTVNNESIEQDTEPTSANDKEMWFEEYKNTNPDIEQALNYASTVMGEDLSESLNTLIDSDDEQVRVGALRTIQHLHQNPSSFASAEESTGVSEDYEQLIASQYGTEMAHAVSVLGNGVASGAISSQQAIQTASKNPQLLNVLYTLAADPNSNFRIAL